MINNDARYTYCILYVLNEIQYKLLFEKKRDIKYLFELNTTNSRQSELTYLEEENVLNTLVAQGVLIENEETVFVELGEKGTTKYKTYLHFSYIATEKFEEAYKITTISNGGNVWI